jgi:hypothetical protein
MSVKLRTVLKLAMIAHVDEVVLSNFFAIIFKIHFCLIIM